MRKLQPLFGQINLIQRQQGDPGWYQPHTNDEILQQPPIKVATYNELVTHIAPLQHYNRNITLFFRGQATDRQKDGLTQLLPSIFRIFPGETRLMLKQRFQLLHQKTEALKKLLASQTPQLGGTRLVTEHPELAWALLQHYQVCLTPVLDITHSIHVACSFAFDGNKGKTGMVYVLGMPWANDAIAYNTFEELVNIRLLSICPPEAQRPFFQEGYLTCHFPNYKMDNVKRVEQYDVARRVIAKFEFPIAAGFWGKAFMPIPHAKLYPAADTMDTICLSLRDR
jgi:hypothetical protein